jgi:hypothetical protein
MKRQDRRCDRTDGDGLRLHEDQLPENTVRTRGHFVLE